MQDRPIYANFVAACRVVGILPCAVCGQHCGSQLEFVEDNDGEPWPTCSACFDSPAGCDIAGSALVEARHVA